MQVVFALSMLAAEPTEGTGLNFFSLDPVMHAVAGVIGVVGVTVIVWGVLIGLTRLIRAEYVRLKGGDAEELRSSVRHILGFYLLLGLEFLVAADIVETILAPNIEHLAVLGAIIVIRTVISFSLNWELHQEKKAEAELQAGGAGQGGAGTAG